VPDLCLREWAAVVPLIVMMVWMGVYSQSFLAPVGKTTARVLAQSEINVPFDARKRAPQLRHHALPLEAANAR
jgi:NADH-quinone oxidoreductase subunit M